MTDEGFLEQLSQSRTNEEVVALLDSMDGHLIQVGDSDQLAKIMLAISQGTSEFGNTLVDSLTGLAELSCAPPIFNSEDMEVAARRAKGYLGQIERCVFHCLLRAKGADDLPEHDLQLLINDTLGIMGWSQSREAGDAFWAGYLLTAKGRGPHALEALSQNGARHLAEYLTRWFDSPRGTAREAGYVIRLSQMITGDDYSALPAELSAFVDSHKHELIQAAWAWAAPEDIGKELLTRAAFRPHVNIIRLLRLAPKEVLTAMPSLFQAMPEWMGKDPDKPDTPGVCCLGMQINAMVCLEKPLATLGVNLLDGADRTLGDRMAQRATTQASGITQELWLSWGRAYLHDRFEGLAQEARPEVLASKGQPKL